MKNTIKLFVICCVLIANIHSRTNAMEDTLCDYIDEELYITSQNEYINSFKSNYNELSSCIKEQLMQLKYCNKKKAINKKIQGFISEILDSLNVSLNSLTKLYKSELYSISIKCQNDAFNNNTYEFTEYEKNILHNSTNDTSYDTYSNNCHNEVFNNSKVLKLDNLHTSFCIEGKNEILSNSEVLELDNLYKACNNAKFCKLLTKCNLYLSTLLNTFYNLKQRKYNIKHFDKIKESILSIKNDITI